MRREIALFHVKHTEPSRFDVVVVGGGHAGVEAAAASARMGASTALITQRLSSIGTMSCNPAIGGLGKGHLVREIDALDGIMGRAADAAAIQFRLLNRRKGPAVQGARVQADRNLYSASVQQILAEQPCLTLLSGECIEFLHSNSEIDGVLLSDGRLFRCGALVLTTGTFLNGVIHRGQQRISAGRDGDRAVTRLPEQLRSLGLRMGRLKTGTPPRLDGRSINFEILDPQWGDDKPQFLSSLTTRVAAPQTLCFLTRTAAATHEIVKRNLDKTATYSGAITGTGPRYCPSIEDKVVKFANHTSHNVFLEPEGIDSNIIYPNGISTSLPIEVQTELVRTIPGLAKVNILRPGYAIEYDFISPTELTPALMSKQIRGLFLAGQINGTTGYEEAAGQGIVAGMNAAYFASGNTSEVLDRTNSYLGVMIDDLTTRGVTEPYRMFTSRAEFRLSLRADNADERLTPIGMRLGVIGNSRRIAFASLMAQLERARALLHQLTAPSSLLASAGMDFGRENVRRSAFEWAGRPNLELSALCRIWPELGALDVKLLSRLDADAKYHIYVARQKADIERQKADERLALPVDFDFGSIAGLSNELKGKFNQNRPVSVGHASRIEGVTPAALLLLAAHAKRLQRTVPPTQADGRI